MPSRKQTFSHVFDGGWATDFGENAEVAISQSGRVGIPFLIESLNTYYHLDGAAHKIGGTTRMNSTAANNGAEIIGMFDYWKGAGSTPTRKIVIHTELLCMAADMDGDFSNIKTGLTDDVAVNYNTFDDLLIIASDSSDVPAQWDQSTYKDLNASAPNFAFSETHKNRVWAAGVQAFPSRLYYSAHVDPEDWSGAGSGFIDIDPNDGDSITGLASHKDNLWVFKGPYKGSIHRIIGSAPTGSDSFGRQTFMRGLGAAWQNTIFRFKDDLGFMWSDGSVHSLAATAAFGDFNEAALSRPINGWILDHINANRLKYAWAAVDSVRGQVVFTIPINTATKNNHHIVMDYRFDPPRWSHWDAFDSGAVATVVDSGIPQLFSGGNDGFVRKLNRSGRSIDTLNAITYKMITPFLSYGSPHKFKVIERASVGVNPIADDKLDFMWTRDNNNTQTFSTTQGGSGNRLGPKKGDITLFESGSTTKVTSASHNLSNGDKVTISGTSNYNGLFTVSNALTNTFDITATFGSDEAPDGTITAFASGSNTQVTTSGAHGLSNGMEVKIAGTTSYNGYYEISGVTATTFQIDETFVANDATGTWARAARWILGEEAGSAYFVLGVSTLGGAQFLQRFMSLEEGGEFRSIRYAVTNTTINQDIELHNIGATIGLSADSGEN